MLLPAVLVVVVRLEAPCTVHLALSKGSWLRTKRGLCQSRRDTCKSYCPRCFPLSDLFWSLTYLGMICVIVKIETYHKTLTEKVHTKLTLQSCEDGVQLVTFQFNSKVFTKYLYIVGGGRCGNPNAESKSKNACMTT